MISLERYGLAEPGRRFRRGPAKAQIAGTSNPIREARALP